MTFFHQKLFISLFCCVLFFSIASSVYAVQINNISAPQTSVGLYQKYEIRFNVSTNAPHTFFEYTNSPPPGVTPGTGITVEAAITTPSGRIVMQPGFFMTEGIKVGSGKSTYFQETNNSFWAIRFAPTELGTYKLTLRATDSSGTTSSPQYTFTSTPSNSKGFIQVSKQDPRYWEFSNGDIYWPIGPAWEDNEGKSLNPGARSYDNSQYKDTGINYSRPWMAGTVAYSGAFATWLSSSEKGGNEGHMAYVSYKTKAPGSEVSYEVSYNPNNLNGDPTDYSNKNPFRYWLTTWGNTLFTAPSYKPNTQYQVLLKAKLTNINGPRVAGQPYGFVAKMHDQFAFVSNETPQTQTENLLRNNLKLFNHMTGTRDWFIQSFRFTTTSNPGSDLSIYLDNVTSGQANIDEFSVKEVISDPTPSSINGDEVLGGEMIRHPRADLHTYVEQKAAAYWDWLLTDAQQNGVYYQLVVHDKNDFFQNHLNPDGSWTDKVTTPNGEWAYYQSENTKARWLLRQWYRYLQARWGYSTAVMSWELNNEGPPDPGAGHYETAEAFAKYIRSIGINIHPASTSFWCCWRPAFWGNNTLYGDVTHADLHFYTDHTEPVNFDINDFAGSYINLGKTVYASNVGKPIVINETGISPNTPAALNQINQGIYFHNMIWSGIGPWALPSPNFWYDYQLKYINREAIATPFWNFIKDIPLNKGGFIDILANSTNANLRVIGQKNTQLGYAYVWIQNKNHEWSNTNPPPQSGTISISLSPNSQYNLVQFNTYNSQTTTQTINSDASGQININIQNLSDDVAYKVMPTNYINPTSVPTSTDRPGDANRDGVVNGTDFAIWKTEYINHTGLNSDFNNSGSVDGQDFIIWKNAYLVG